MKRNLTACLVILTCFSWACSKQNWKARFSIYRAEQIYWKANYTLKSRKVSFEDRKPYYAKACEYFLKALESDPSVFHGARIEEASQSCASGDMREASFRFEEVYHDYCKKHPKECEYGELAPPEVEF